MKKTIATIIAAMAFYAGAQESDFKVATGDMNKGSTYVTVFNDFQKFCNNALPMTQVGTTGGTANLEMLTGNQVKAALLPEDLLFYFKQVDPEKVRNVRTLFALYPEELHFIARSDTKTEGGVLGFGGKSVQYSKVTDLAGRAIGAVGGSVYSARIFAAQSGINFSVAEYPSNDAMLADLGNLKIDAVLIVGGAPHAAVKSMNNRFRLLSVDSVTQAKVAKMYAPATLSYSNFAQAGVPSVATQAVFATRVFSSQTTLTKLKALRSCFDAQLPEIKDADKTHPKWQIINSSNHGKWEWYQL